MIKTYQFAEEPSQVAADHPGQAAGNFEEIVIVAAMDFFKHSTVDGSPLSEAPIKVLSRGDDHAGLGAEWASGEKRAITFGGPHAWNNYREARQRLKAWIDEGR